MISSPRPIERPAYHPEGHTCRFTVSSDCLKGIEISLRIIASKCVQKIQNPTRFWAARPRHRFPSRKRITGSEDGTPACEKERKSVLFARFRIEQFRATYASRLSVQRFGGCRRPLCLR